MSIIVPIETITGKIYVIRGQKVILDRDLAGLYDVPTRRLNEQVRRNKERFPEDFMFQLTRDEIENLKSQFATSSEISGHGGSRHRPLVFTEHGALMAASVLKSQRAVAVSIHVVRAFANLRKMLASHKDLKKKSKTWRRNMTGSSGWCFRRSNNCWRRMRNRRGKLGFELSNAHMSKQAPLCACRESYRFSFRVAGLI